MKIQSFLFGAMLVLASCATTAHKETKAATPPAEPSAAVPGASAASASTTPAAAPVIPDASAAKDPGLTPAVISGAPENPPVPPENTTVDPTLPTAGQPAAEKAEAAAPAAPAVAESKAEDSSGATLTMIKKSGKPAPPAAAAVVAAKKGGVDPKLALKWLEHGNQRFVKGSVRKDGQAKKDIKRVSVGQKPHTIVIGCSDSRVPPELVFDQKLGEIFVVRTLGETLDDNAIASVEYAVQQLGPRLIVVLGHTYCGAVTAAIETQAGADVGSAAFNHMIADIQPRIRESLTRGTPEADGASESFANAKGVGDDLKARSAIIREAVESGEIMIQPALYRLDTGKVTFR